MKDNKLIDISMMIETVLGYIEMKKYDEAVKHLEVAQSLCNPTGKLAPPKDK